MCPRFVRAKIRPGDLVWCMMEDGTQLYYDEEAGANPDAKESAGIAGHKVPCLCLAVDDDRLVVLAPNGRYGWTHRIWWERAGEEKQEYESLSAPSEEAA